MGKARVEQWRLARIKQRRVLRVVVGIVDLMFFVQLITGFMAQSVSLQADALDFSDSTTADESIVNARLLPRHKAIVMFMKGAITVLLGLGIAGMTVWNLLQKNAPDVQLMAIVGTVALAANTAALAMLWPQRTNNSALKTAWACARNDVIGNLAVLLAALGVYGTGQTWPDTVIATVMIPFSVRTGWLIAQKARHDLSQLRASPVGAKSPGRRSS